MLQYLQLSQVKGNNLVYGLVRAGTGWRVILQGSKQAELTTAVSHVPRDKYVTMTSQSAYNRLKSCPSHYVVVRKRSTRPCPLQRVHKKGFQKNMSSEVVEMVRYIMLTKADVNLKLVCIFIINSKQGEQCFYAGRPCSP